MRFSPFVFSMPSYVITLPTGATNYSTLLPIYASAGVSARLIGFDAEAIWHAADPLQLSLTVSYTRGDNLTGQTALPVIPPLRAKFDVRYAISSLTIGASCEVAAGQDRVAPFESPTAGYGTLSVFTQWILPTTDFTHTFNFSASNLLDQEYRNHLSRARSILPESGRNFRIMYKIYF
jgi:iron complex outermembrane receptor protein